MPDRPTVRGKTRIEASREPRQGQGVTGAVVVGAFVCVLSIAYVLTKPAPVTVGLDAGERQLVRRLVVLREGIDLKILVAADRAWAASTAPNFAPAGFVGAFVTPLLRDVRYLRDGAASLRARVGDRPQNDRGRALLSDVPTDARLAAWESALERLAALLGRWPTLPRVEALDQLRTLRRQWPALTSSASGR